MNFRYPLLFLAVVAVKPGPHLSYKAAETSFSVASQRYRAHLFRWDREPLRLVAEPVLSSANDVDDFTPDGPIMGKPSSLAPAEVPQDWYTAITQQISASEYHIRWQEASQSFQSPNRQQGLRISYRPNGFELTPRTDSTWRVGLELDRIGRKGHWLQPRDNATMTADGPTLVADHGTFTIDYRNGEEGMRQNFTVHERPAGEGRLEVRLLYSGTLHAADKGDNAIAFCAATTTESYTPTVWYKDLHVWDANGDTLEAMATLEGEEIVLSAMDAGAVYPVTVDPLSLIAGWSVDTDQLQSQFGSSVADAGDVNNDGYDDVIVGAPFYDITFVSQGRAYVYHGSPTGLSATPAWVADGSSLLTFFGASVSGAGDVNGDGYDDVIVGSNWTNFGASQEGRVFAFHGSANGLSATASWSAMTQVYDQFGTSVSNAGDVNNDGYGDVIVGAPYYDNGQTNEGRVLVYHGSGTGLSLTPNWSRESNLPGAAFGYSVSCAGDVNGDGFSDVVIGASYLAETGYYDGAGRAYVYHGSATGLSTTSAWSVISDQADAGFGASVSNAGDVNGDGFDDVIVAAPSYDSDMVDEGRAFVYHGSSSGLSTTAAWITEGDQIGANLSEVGCAGDVNGDGFSDVIVGAINYTNSYIAEGRALVFHGRVSGIATEPAWERYGSEEFLRFGQGVSSAGDVNGDGYSDVIVGGSHNSIDLPGSGIVQLYYGGGPPVFTVGGQTAANYGFSVSGAGDVNGDGYADLIVGAPYYDNGQSNEGRAWVFPGGDTGPSAIPVWTAESDLADASFGYCVSGAGDVNNDGYADVIVGAPYYDSDGAGGRAYAYLGSTSGLAAMPVWVRQGGQANAQFGRSVSSAGDVNGDGRGDVIVGAPFYDNGQTDEGRVLVYHGTSNGLAAAANWTAESDQANARYGQSVSEAGDVNGDGRSDVLVGAPFFDNGQTDEGRAYLYTGSPTGLAATAIWTTEGNQTSAQLGMCVSGAGDVNNDGYADVIVGVPLGDNGQADEGRAYVYHGGLSGLTLAPVWVAESDQDAARFGWSVSGAGDVNNDGFGDVIVGAPQYDNGHSNEGRVWIYHGGASGLASTAAWSTESNQANAQFGISVCGAGDLNGDGYGDVAVGAPVYSNGQTGAGRTYIYLGSGPPILEIDQSFAQFGKCVSSAGDVNGDGFDDVIVGAPDYWNGQIQGGAAFVFHGSPNGLGSSPSWTAVGDQQISDFGNSVSSAGDVNGDGYDDVIVGARYYDNGESNEGRAYVYLGSLTGLGSLAAWTAESNQGQAHFGSSVGNAGDVNNDGYGDVVVGARLYDNGQFDEGRAYVYHGSASGLGSNPSWIAESDQANSSFGSSVAGAGDVNGDGYDDVIVGAGSFENGQSGEGRAFVYHGSATGLNATANWTAESDQAGAGFGFSVSCAGDVNNDGYADVIVGSEQYDNGESGEGRAYVFHGSNTGLSTSANWVTEGNVAQAYFGNSVAGAGDVNGDGYDDVIVGAYTLSNGQISEGKAFIYPGSATGLSTTEAWGAEGNSSYAQFGISVSGAGDLNGDGYDDCAVGVYGYSNAQFSEGGAFIYYGMPAANALRFNAKLFLEGPYSATTGLMSDAIRALGSVPLHEPYTSLGYAHVGGGGGESTTPNVLTVTGNDAIVDWVVIELRDPILDPTDRLYTRSALLQRDGDVVATDGTSTIRFNVPPGSYHIAVRHRNHLAAMTAVPVTLGVTSSLVDFTLPGLATYGTNARKSISGAFPAQVLWAGDATFNGELKYTGSGNDRDPVLVTVGGSTPNNTVNGYFRTDVNMDGIVKYTGASNDRDPILVNVGGTTPSNVRTEQLP